VTRNLTGLVPLSVAADRIGLAAMRCASPLARLAAAGQPVDRAGAGVVVEVYPAAALKRWGLTHSGYKGAGNAAVRHRLVDALSSQAPWLRLGSFEEACRRSDHALDAVIAAQRSRRRARPCHRPQHRAHRCRPDRRLDRTARRQPRRPHPGAKKLTGDAAHRPPRSRTVPRSPDQPSSVTTPRRQVSVVLSAGVRIGGWTASAWPAGTPVGPFGSAGRCGVPPGRGRRRCTGAGAPGGEGVHRMPPPAWHGRVRPGGPHVSAWADGRRQPALAGLDARRGAVGPGRGLAALLPRRNRRLRAAAGCGLAAGRPVAAGRDHRAQRRRPTTRCGPTTG
jgi:hypothetical protein